MQYTIKAHFGNKKAFYLLALVKSAWKSIRTYPKVKPIHTGKIVADDSHDEAWTGI